jgi:hypothetical protein
VPERAIVEPAVRSLLAVDGVEQVVGTIRQCRLGRLLSLIPLGRGDAIAESLGNASWRELLSPRASPPTGLFKIPIPPGWIRSAFLFLEVRPCPKMLKTIRHVPSATVCPLGSNGRWTTRRLRITIIQRCVFCLALSPASSMASPARSIAWSICSPADVRPGLRDRGFRGSFCGFIQLLAGVLGRPLTPHSRPAPLPAP